MQILRLEKRDIKECLDIYNYYIKNTVFSLEENEVGICEYEKKIEEIISKYPFLVAKDDGGKVLGFAYLDVYNKRSAYRHTADLTIYVNKDCLHCNIGYKLLSHIQKTAKEIGITNIISIITDENRNSCLFHERNGFVSEGHIHDVAIKFGKSIGVFYYRKSL